MKTNVQQKAGRKIETITFEYVCPSTKETKEIKVVMHDPNFDELCEAYKYMYDENGKFDPITCGKLVLDLCALEYSEEMLNPRIMMCVCSRLRALYVEPILVEIKKKD